jgi:hypothetical protein
MLNLTVCFFQVGVHERGSRKVGRRHSGVQNTVCISFQFKSIPRWPVCLSLYFTFAVVEFQSAGRSKSQHEVRT